MSTRRSPRMVEPSRPPSPRADAVTVTRRSSAAFRDVLGWRPRVGDPKAFVDALAASFRLAAVEGHIVAEYVPRGYAVQADLGAVTGGRPRCIAGPRSLAPRCSASSTG